MTIVEARASGPVVIVNVVGKYEGVKLTVSEAFALIQQLLTATDCAKGYAEAIAGLVPDPRPPSCTSEKAKAAARERDRIRRENAKR